MFKEKLGNNKKEMGKINIELKIVFLLNSHLISIFSMSNEY